jgi:hypothetical protein
MSKLQLYSLVFKGKAVELTPLDTDRQLNEHFVANRKSCHILAVCVVASKNTDTVTESAGKVDVYLRLGIVGKAGNPEAVKERVSIQLSSPFTKVGANAAVKAALVSLDRRRLGRTPLRVVGPTDKDLTCVMDDSDLVPYLVKGLGMQLHLAVELKPTKEAKASAKAKAKGKKGGRKWSPEPAQAAAGGGGSEDVDSDEDDDDSDEGDVEPEAVGLSRQQELQALVVVARKRFNELGYEPDPVRLAHMAHEMFKDPAVKKAAMTAPFETTFWPTTWPRNRQPVLKVQVAAPPPTPVALPPYPYAYPPPPPYPYPYPVPPQPSPAGAAAGPPPGAPPVRSIEGRLERLKEAFDKGLIGQDTFTRRQGEIAAEF